MLKILILRKNSIVFLGEYTGISWILFEHQIYHRLARNMEEFLILFLEDYEAVDNKQAMMEVRKVAKRVKKIIPIAILEKGGKDESGRVYNEEGVSSRETPVVYIIERGINKRYKLQGPITGERIEQFVHKWKAGKLKPTYKSAPVPERNDNSIKDIVGDTWNEIVIDNDKDVLVEWYAPGCHTCEQVEPYYRAIGERLKNNPNLVLGRIDSTSNEIEGLAVASTPSWKFFKNGKKNDPIPVYGCKSYGGILESLKNLVTHPWVEDAPKTEEL